MSVVYGVREIVRNPSLLRIKGDEIITIEDKKTHSILGLYIGKELGEEFSNFLEKKKLLDSAKKIKEASLSEYKEWGGTLGDRL